MNRYYVFGFYHSYLCFFLVFVVFFSCLQFRPSPPSISVLFSFSLSSFSTLYISCFFFFSFFYSSILRLIFPQIGLACIILSGKDQRRSRPRPPRARSSCVAPSPAADALTYSPPHPNSTVATQFSRILPHSACLHPNHCSHALSLYPASLFLPLPSSPVATHVSSILDRSVCHIRTIS